jgi:hypothetical protein
VPQSEPTCLETDVRFPTGPWTGFFLQPTIPGRHMMELHLTFSQGSMKGEGRDWVGKFLIRGQYTIADGKCHWTKRYLGKHDVFYQGFNEGKGIWGVWEIHESLYGMRGGFHIWPEGMADPTNNALHEEADLPAESLEDRLIGEPVATPVYQASQDELKTTSGVV